MNFKYSFEKNAKLLAERGIGFDEIIQAISDGNILDIKQHPNPNKYPLQKIMYVRVVEEVFAVPFIEQNDGSFFLKTAFPSRKARKAYLKEF